MKINTHNQIEQLRIKIGGAIIIFTVTFLIIGVVLLGLSQMA